MFICEKIVSNMSINMDLKPIHVVNDDLQQLLTGNSVVMVAEIHGKPNHIPNATIEKRIKMDLNTNNAIVLSWQNLQERLGIEKGELNTKDKVVAVVAFDKSFGKRLRGKTEEERFASYIQKFSLDYDSIDGMTLNTKVTLKIAGEPKEDFQAGQIFSDSSLSLNKALRMKIQLKPIGTINEFEFKESKVAFSSHILNKFRL